VIPRLDDLLAADPACVPPGEELGRSREGRPVVGWRFGSGPARVSLIAGCHADEPVGPMLLRHLVARLAAAGADAAGEAPAWWIVPDTNPDGAARNAAWVERIGRAVDPVDWLRHAVRELPGDDVEFGFPRGPDDRGARPENRALAAWWRGAGGPFALHASLHGMAIAHGPWFLVEGSWRDRIGALRERCSRETAALGHRLHDVDRRGDKGFERIAPGFSTRPDSRAMARFFRDRGDERTAALFRPSSMEAVVSLGGDPLTLVSEMPLFVVPAPPGGPPETSADVEAWRERLAGWRRRLAGEGSGPSVRAEMERLGMAPMPLRDQMHLQWTLVTAGIDRVLG
jgi:hypothetical protein